MQTTVTLKSDYIKLDTCIKLAGIADSGGQAKELILDGLVKVNGEVEMRRGKKLRAGDVVVVELEPPVEVVVGEQAPHPAEHVPPASPQRGAGSR